MSRHNTLFAAYSVSYSYDQVNRVSGISRGAGGLSVRIRYTVDDKPSSIIDYFGSSIDVNMTYTYNLFDQLTVFKAFGLADFYNMTYSYDAFGNINFETARWGNTKVEGQGFYYDGMDRLNYSYGGGGRNKGRMTPCQTL